MKSFLLLITLLPFVCVGVSAQDAKPVTILEVTFLKKIATPAPILLLSNKPPFCLNMEKE